MREMEVQEFVRRFKDILASQTESRFAFFLGAGCSISSGIPMAGSIVKHDWLPKLKKIKTGAETNLDEWARSHCKKEDTAYDGTNGALFYGDIIEELFLTPESRQSEIERLTLGRDPGFGYGVLAQLVSHKDHGRHCNFILTTNFDDMIPDALYVYSNKKPLVIVHDSLVGFVKISSPRPVVIKLHGDARLAPRNTGDETKSLDEKVKMKIQGLLAEMGLVFIGYGGNDQSITEILKGLPNGAPPHGIWWVNDTIPDGPFGELLRERGAIWVRHLDFDELMLLFWYEFGFDHPENRFDRMMSEYRKTFEQLRKNIEAEPEEKKQRFAGAISEVTAKATDWWTVELEAQKYTESDPEKADQIYREGIKKFSSSPELLGNYALFLDEKRKDYDTAEQYYKLAVEADPKDADYLGNYAVFLDQKRKDYDTAEQYYKLAVKANPKHADSLGNYAVFLEQKRKDYDAAEQYYKRAVEADPKRAINLGNYAGFLLARGYVEEGFNLFNRAMEQSDPASDKGLILECLFYRHAHTRDGAEKHDSLARMKTMLQEGVRSPGWDLSENVKRAVEDGYPNPAFLEKLSAVIADKEDISVLDAFDEWKNA